MSRLNGFGFSHEVIVYAGWTYHRFALGQHSRLASPCKALAANIFLGVAVIIGQCRRNRLLDARRRHSNAQGTIIQRSVFDLRRA